MDATGTDGTTRQPTPTRAPTIPNAHAPHMRQERPEDARMIGIAMRARDDRIRAERQRRAVGRGEADAATAVARAHAAWSAERETTRPPDGHPMPGTVPGTDDWPGLSDYTPDYDDYEAYGDQLEQDDPGEEGHDTLGRSARGIARGWADDVTLGNKPV